MADNYLEKKYEELRQGKTVLRRNTPSLDTLLKRIAQDTEPGHEYVVKQAQLDALVRSAGLSGCKCVFEAFETSAEAAATVHILSSAGAFSLGQAVLALRLKAAELSLDTSVELGPMSEDASGEASAVVFVFRKL